MKKIKGTMEIFKLNIKREKEIEKDLTYRSKLGFKIGEINLVVTESYYEGWGFEVKEEVLPDFSDFESERLAILEDCTYHFDNGVLNSYIVDNTNNEIICVVVKGWGGAILLNKDVMPTYVGRDILNLPDPDAERFKASLSALGI